MGIKTILTEPNKILRQKSLPVKKVNKEIQTLMDDMLETMYAAPGIGLAAVQIGVPKKIIVLDIARDHERGRSRSVPLRYPGIVCRATAVQVLFHAPGA